MQKLEVEFVYETLSLEQKEEVIAMWLQAGVVSPQEALRRVEQVSCLILFGEKIVGVSTVYKDILSQEMGTYFFGRMFITQAYRGSLEIRKKIMQLNFSQLKQSYATQANGLVLELENKKLAKLGEETAYMYKRGYTFYGKSARGLQLWYVRFATPKGIFL